MGREVCIYQLEENRIAERLHDFLRSTEILPIFKGFITERTKNFGDQYALGYEPLLKKVKKGLREVNGDELFEIIYFIEEEIHQVVEGDTDGFLREHGLDKIYGSKTKSEANLFILQFYNYIEVVQELGEDVLPNKDQVSGKVFTGFLDYVIRYLDKVNKMEALDLVAPYSDREQRQLDEIRSRTASNLQFHQLIDRELKMVRELPKLAKKNYHGHARDLLTRCIEMQVQFDDQAQRLVIIDSV